MNASASVIDAVMEAMPPGAEKYLTPLSGGGFNLIIHWKLSKATERPRKYSKTVIIDIPTETIEYFSASPDAIQQETLQKIGEFLSRKLATFDPSHNSPRGTPKPVENWSLSIENLLG